MLVDRDEEPAPTGNALISDVAATAAASAFDALGRDIPVSHSSDNRSLEGIVTDIMRPMLKDWLDENLPEIVEEVVEREVRRIAERRGRRR